jgi:hypothetical protein
MFHKHSLTRITILRLHKRVMVEPNTQWMAWKNVNVCLSSEEVKGVLVYFFPILEIVRDYKHINL